MGDIIYDWTNTVFGPGLANEVGDTITTLLKAMGGVMNDTFLTNIMTLLSGIACSLLVIYFFQDLMNQASRDMFSLEKLIIGFIRMLIAFCVLLYLKEMLGFLVKLANAFTELAKDICGFDNVDAVFKASEETREAYRKEFKGFGGVISALGCALSLLFPWLLSIVAELMAKMIICSNTIMLIVRAALSPIAVVQIFEDGSKSSGMRYLKGLFAEAITFGTILVIIGIANKLSAEWVKNTIKASDLSDPSNLIQCLSFSTIIPMIIPKLAIVGGMAGASKIAHDVMGA